MNRRATIAATLALGLALAAGSMPSPRRIVSSTRTFQRYFQDLKHGAASLNPVERFVYSLVLANTKPEPGAAPEHRT